MNEWGIPNWRDTLAYGETNRWSFNRWRWEFFRRRADLREYFDARAEETYRLNQQKLGLAWAPNAHLRFDEPGFCVRVDGKAAKCFGYSLLPNPRIGGQLESQLFNINDSDSALTIVDGGIQTVGAELASAGVELTKMQALRLSHVLSCHFIKLGPNGVALGFDIEKPLEPQLANARLTLQYDYEKRGFPRQRKRHPAKWFGYLRTLDARADGATWAEIAEIHPNTAQTEQTARDIWQAADALRFNF